MTDPRPVGGTSPRRRVPWRTVLTVSALLLVLIVALLPSPYAIERPGPVFDTLGSSEVDGARTPVIQIPSRTTYPTRGALDLLTVSVVGTPAGGPSWLDLAAAWVDPTQAVVPLEAVYPAGVSQGEADQESAQEMRGSQQSAITAALRRLGEPVQARVRIASVAPGSAAAGALRTGDVVTSFAGATVTDSCTLQDLVLAHGTAPTSVMITRGGATRRVTVTPRLTDVGGTKRPLLGVSTAATYSFPFAVRLRLSDVGGPSAGMMFALGIIDKLTPGALTGGKHVAGTGTICGDGTVGAIGGIVQKMAAARRAGATVFLAPAADCDEVVGHIPSGLSVYSVKRLSEALAVLKAVATNASTARLARCSSQVGSPR